MRIEIDVKGPQEHLPDNIHHVIMDTVFRLLGGVRQSGPSLKCMTFVNNADKDGVSVKVSYWSKDG